MLRSLQVRCAAFPPQLPPQIQHVRSHKTQKVFSVLRAPPLLALDYQNLQQMIDKKQVTSVEVTKNSEMVTVTTPDNDTLTVSIPTNKSLELIELLTKADIPVYYQNKSQPLPKITTILSVTVQVLIIASFSLMLYQILTQRVGNIGSKQFEAIKTNITFEDVAGVKNAKQDLQEIVEFLQNPEKFSKLGAKIPRGVLLYGPPGSGKTLCAKAVAGEAGVPFFSCSASEMIQVYVGVGAQRIRQLFEKAKKHAPSIIFIDELDAIAKARGSGPSNGGNDERDQTINQLLTEMDGFNTNTGVIVIAATNRHDILDPALMRPGRFDRLISVELPDFKDRVDIMKVHTKNKPLESDFNLDHIAKITTGYSGADLANLANEAAILAARNNQITITKDNFYQALDKITLGEKRDIIVTDEKKRIVAFHEAGHALVALKTNLYQNIRTISIIPRGKTGGVTIFEPKDSDLDSQLFTREYLENQIAVALGGRIAEELEFGPNQITTGAASDIQVVQKIARHMVTHYGLSSELGAIAWHPDQHYSEKLQATIDEEIKQIVTKIYIRTRAMLIANKDVLDLISNELIVHEVMSGTELEQLITKHHK